MERSRSAPPRCSAGLPGDRAPYRGIAPLAPRLSSAPPAPPPPQQPPAPPALAYLVFRASSLSAPPCRCYLCSTRQLEGRRSITGVHTGFSADGAALSGPSLWAKLQPYFAVLPSLSGTATTLLEEYRWCIEPWASEESALEAWKARAGRYGHADHEAPVHLWLDASRSQIELCLEAGASEILHRLHVESGQ
jgi:hypothetical protein